MKKNLILGGIFLLLLVATYIFQEKRDERAYQQSLTKDHLIVSGIKELTLPHVQAKKVKNAWWDGERLLSHNSFVLIEKKLTEIKKLKEIEGDKKTYFADPLAFSVNGEPWIIGDLSFDKQGFYLSRNGKILLVAIEGESTELTQDESAIAATKYNELRTHLSKSREELTEKQLFRYYPELKFSRVLVEAYERLPYELDLVKNQTLPSPIPGINVHAHLNEKFTSLLTQVTLREEVPYTDALKRRLMGRLKFLHEKPVIWEVWLPDEKSADAVVIDPDRKKAFLMVGGTLKLWFTMVQDYWDKKIIPPSVFRSFDRLPMLLSQGTQSAQVDVLNREPLQFESARHRLNSDNLLGMVNIIFNLSQFDQADRVSLLSNSERKMVMNDDPLRVIVMDQELALWVKPQELIVVNLTQGFKAHFTMFHEKQGLTFKDMVK